MNRTILKPVINTPIIIAFLLFAFAAEAQRQNSWTILPRQEAEEMRQPCSRPFPDGLSGWWEPTKAEIERAEKKLPDAIDAAFARLQRPEDRRRRPNHYYRQYAGFYRNGKRLIYVNAFTDYPMEDRVGKEWRTKYVWMCDSGTSTFGAVYDLEKDAFDSFVFSGRYEGRVPGGGW